MDLELGSPKWWFNGKVPVRFDLAAGLEYEDVFKSSSGVDGNTLRATARGGVILFPLFAKVKTQFQLGMSLQYWDELNSSGSFDDMNDDFTNWSVYANYFFNSKETIGLGVTYVDGDDPSKGLLDQKYTQVGLVIRTGK